MIVIDREHVEGEKYLRRATKEYGFELEDFTKIDEYAYRLEVKRGVKLQGYTWRSMALRKVVLKKI